MGVDIKSFSPEMQRQIITKMVKEKSYTQSPKPKNREPKSKYNNQKDQRGTVKFDSKKEAKRYDELTLLLQAGKIRDLKLQREFTLQEAYTTPDGERINAIRYRADFTYERLTNKNEWEFVVEDVKSKATATPVYKMKKKMLHEKYGYLIEEV